MNSPHMDFSLAPRAQGLGSWLETLVITALALGLGLWLTPDDPLQVRGEFPWPLLAPLLLRPTPLALRSTPLAPP